jgi:hypothetical protein
LRAVNVSAVTTFWLENAFLTTLPWAGVAAFVTVGSLGPEWTVVFAVSVWRFLSSHVRQSGDPTYDLLRAGIFNDFAFDKEGCKTLIRKYRSFIVHALTEAGLPAHS